MEDELIFDVVRGDIESSRMDLGDPEEFARLVERAGAALGGAGGGPPDDPMRFLVLTAMALLGPRIGLPEPEMVETLYDLATQYCDEADHEAIFDLVAAFGCGWRRNPGVLDEGWDGLWTGAFTYFTKRVRHVCYAVYDSLTGKLHVQFPPEDLPKPLLTETAQAIAKKLVQPIATIATGEQFCVTAGGSDGDPIFAGLTVTTDAGWEEDIPTGARAVYHCTDGAAKDEEHRVGFESGDTIRMVSSETVSNLQIWSEDWQTKKHEKKPTAGQQLVFDGDARLQVVACTCGKSNCDRWHRLAAWDPGEEFGKLQYFLYSAIRGRMQQIKARDFAQGLLGSHWAREGLGRGHRLRLAEVVHHACVSEECRDQDESNAVRIYSGDRCDRCGAATRPQTPLVTRERLIFVDTEHAMWEFHEYWRCGHADCEVPALEHEGRTLIDAEDATMKKAALCSHCNHRFWPDELRLEVGKIIADAKTLLAATRRLESMRLEHHCESCGKPGEATVYCTVCRDHGRPGKLPARPSWFFARARADIEEV